MTSILNPAIRMMNATLDRSSLFEPHPQSRYGELSVDLLRKRPANHSARKQIQNHRQIYKARQNPYIRDIGHPNLIAPLDLKPLAQIRINPIPVFTVGGPNPAPLHLTLKRPFPHHPCHPLVIDLPPLAPELMGHPPITVACTLHHNLFNPISQIGFLLLGLQGFRLHPIVIGAARKPHHFAPPLEAAKVLAVIGDECSFLRRALYSTAFFKSSFSIVSLPPSAPAPLCAPKTASHSAMAPPPSPLPQYASSNTGSVPSSHRADG